MAMIAGAGLTTASIGGYLEVIDWSAERSATGSIDNVLYAAHMYLPFHDTWAESLEAAHLDMVRGTEAVTLSGTVITWEHDGYCYTVNVPEPAYTAEPVTCQ
jgi:hypothetical protein